MSSLDSALNVEPAEEPAELTLRRMVCAIDYAEGFWLGLAKSNTPAQRRRLAALCRDLLEPLKIRVLEIELNEPVTDLLPMLRERLAQERASNDERDATGEAAATTRPKLAVFVHGLERSIPSREAYPPLLSSLNLKRELFRQDVPHPLLLWLPDYALTALARKAPDFWAWRSGLYEFAPERDDVEQLLAIANAQETHITESLSEKAKRERLIMLKGLLEDYRELGASSREHSAQASILAEIGLTHGVLGEWTEARHAFRESLTLSRALKAEAEEAAALHNLGRVAREQRYLEEARRLYDESLKISRKRGDQMGIASTLHELAIIAQDQGAPEEARRLYDESLEIKKNLGAPGNIVSTLYELARLAQNKGQLEEARRLYSESLEIAKQHGYQFGVAMILHQLGWLGEAEGDRAEAIRLFREALSIFKKLGSPNSERALQSLARLEVHDDDIH